MTTERLEAFSDGCVAIFITIILLGLKFPKGNTYNDLLPMIPSIICYAMSFIVIAIYWGNQHHLLHTVIHVTSKIMWTNFAWLFALSLVSFATAWAARSMLAPHTVSFYGVIMLACNRTYVILENAVVEQEKIEAAEMGTVYNLEEILGERLKENIAMVLYFCGTVVSFWIPPLAMAMYFIVDAMWFVPDRRISNSHCKPR